MHKFILLFTFATIFGCVYTGEKPVVDTPVIEAPKDTIYGIDGKDEWDTKYVCVGHTTNCAEISTHIITQEEWVRIGNKPDYVGYWYKHEDKIFISDSVTIVINPANGDVAVINGDSRRYYIKEYADN